MAIQFKAGTPKQGGEFFVEPGEYDLRVIEAKQDTSKAGSDMIKLKLRVLKEDGSEGPALFDYLVFTGSSFWKVDSFLKSCGQHPGEGSELDLDPDEMIGWECHASLKVEMYEGNKNNKIASYLWDDGGF